MGGGDSLYDKIDRGIRGSKVVLSCVTHKYALSANCRREVSLADALKKPLVPLLLEDMSWPPPGPMALVMTQLLYITFTRDNEQNTWTEAQFDELVSKIREHVPKPIEENLEYEGTQSLNSTPDKPTCAKTAFQGNSAPSSSTPSVNVRKTKDSAIPDTPDKTESGTRSTSPAETETTAKPGTPVKTNTPMIPGTPLRIEILTNSTQAAKTEGIVKPVPFPKPSSEPSINTETPDDPRAITPSKTQVPGKIEIPAETETPVKTVTFKTQGNPSQQESLSKSGSKPSSAREDIHSDRVEKLPEIAQDSPNRVPKSSRTCSIL